MALKEQNAALETELARTKIRSVKVYEENSDLKANKLIASKRQEMEYFMSMADKFIQSKAFNCDNAAQAYVKIMAGKEMGLSPIESMNALYVVNGSVNAYGKFMIARLAKNGYRIEYLDEDERQVTIKVTGPDNFIAVEKVTDRDQILQRSKAMGFAKKNKMRYHGVRMIINFHLAHLFGSVSDLFDEQYNEYQEVRTESPKQKIETVTKEKERQRVIDWIDTCMSMASLKQVEDMINGDEELQRYYDDRSSLLEEYELCMTEILSEFREVVDANSMNRFISKLQNIDPVLNSHAIAREQVSNKVKELGLILNTETGTYEQPDDESE